MKVAAIYDIHGNLPALEAVLAEIHREEAELVVIGGDVVLGPMSREALEHVLNLDIPTKFIKGNCEAAVLAEMTGGKPAVPENIRKTLSWTSGQFEVEHAQIFSRWPGTIRLNLSDLGNVLFCHATPRNENEIFTRLTPEKNLLTVFQGLDVSLVVCGHTHMQFDRTIGGIRVVNAGSVGMPFGKTGADWLMLDDTIQFRHTSYDLRKAAERMRGTKYPQASEFIEENVLHSPSEQRMLEIFANVEIAR